MKVTVLLADAAEVVNGKVYGLGFGWNTTVTPTPPASVVVLLDIPWSQSGSDVTVRLELLDADGRSFLVPGPDGAQPLVFDAGLRIDQVDGVVPGSTTKIPLVINLGAGLPLTPGRFEWRATVNGEHREDWSEYFTAQAPGR